MANIFNIFTVTNFLILSLSLNASLILHILYDNDTQDFLFTSEKPDLRGLSVVADEEASATMRTRLSVSSTHSHEDMDRVINLNQ